MCFLESETEVTTVKGSLSSTLVFDRLEIDADRHRITYDQQDVYLTAMEFKVLYFMAVHKNQVCSPRQIYEAVEEESYMAGEYIIKNIIYKLRKKLSPAIIHTIRGRGYQFVCE